MRFNRKAMHILSQDYFLDQWKQVTVSSYWAQFINTTDIFFYNFIRECTSIVRMQILIYFVWVNIKFIDI